MRHSRNSSIATGIKLTNIITPTIAAIGAPIKSATGSNAAPPKIAAPEPDAAIPAMKSNESPGKARPTKSPVSAKMIARTPINPRSPTIEWAVSYTHLTLPTIYSV